MEITNRDTADFYRIALENSHINCHLVQVADVIVWCDSLIASSDIPNEWMINLSLAETPDAVIRALKHVPPPATKYLSASMFIAHLNRLWSSGAISRDYACHLVWNIRDDLNPEYDLAASVPELTLEDATACFEQGLRNPNPFTRVDDALTNFFGRFNDFDLLIPTVSFCTRRKPYP